MRVPRGFFGPLSAGSDIIIIYSEDRLRQAILLIFLGALYSLGYFRLAKADGGIDVVRPEAWLGAKLKTRHFVGH